MRDDCCFRQSHAYLAYSINQCQGNAYFPMKYRSKLQRLVFSCFGIQTVLWRNLSCFPIWKFWSPNLAVHEKVSTDFRGKQAEGIEGVFTQTPSYVSYCHLEERRIVPFLESEWCDVQDRFMHGALFAASCLSHCCKAVLCRQNYCLVIRFTSRERTWLQEPCSSPTQKFPKSPEALSHFNANMSWSPVCLWSQHWDQFLEPFLLQNSRELRPLSPSIANLRFPILIKILDPHLVKPGFSHGSFEKEREGHWINH